jgi:hypothetical protein
VKIRFERLKQSEKYISGKIAGITETAISSLIAKLSKASGPEKVELEKSLFKANQHLLVLRKDHRAANKQLSDLEFKRANLHEGMIAIDLVRDSLTRCLLPAFQYCRNLSASVVDESEKARLDAISRGFIITFREAIRQLLMEIGSDKASEFPAPNDIK